MKQQSIESAHYWLSMMFTGLGISFAPHQFVGGLFLALAAGALVARHRRSKRRIWSVLGTAALVATITVLVTQESNHWDIAPQLIMAASGGASGWLVNFFIKLMDEATERSERIIDRLIDRILPSRNGGGK